MEKWDLYNEKRELVGRTVERGEEIPEGLYHLVVEVWIRKGEQYLISRRAASRPHHPLMYECPGGSVLAGESSLDGAIREAKEEVGIELPRDGKLLKSDVRPKYRNIHDIWLFSVDCDFDLSEATTDEVESASWLTIEEIKELVARGEFVPTICIP